MPVLIDDSVQIFESTVILEYIEERWPDPPLLPRDPAARAFAHITEDVCDTHYEALNWGFGEILWYKRASGALAERMMAEDARQTAVLSAWLTERSGQSPWFGGETFGWADAAGRANGQSFSALWHGALAIWHARLRDRPSVADTFAGFDAVAARMGEMAGAYASGDGGESIATIGWNG